jgi:heme-degrading monooxygenase HmoA
MLRVRLSQVTADAGTLGSCVAYIAGEDRQVVESQPGSLGLLALASQKLAVVVTGSLWATDLALIAGQEADSYFRGELARRAGGPVAVRDYQVVIFEREAPLRAGQAVRLTRLEVKPSWVDDVIHVVGDTAVPALADAPGFRGALLFADPDAGQLVSQTVWLDARARSAGPSVGATVRAELLDEARCEILAVEDYDLVFTSLPLRVLAP